MRAFGPRLAGMRRRKRSVGERYRLVAPKHAQTDEHLNDIHSKYNLGNSIKTTKYSLWSFLPKNLFEQFHRFANIYFLMIIILNLIPEINAFGKYIAMVPLIFVLSVTAIKDLYEDRRRYKSDKAVNNNICHVFNRWVSLFSNFIFCFLLLLDLPSCIFYQVDVDVPQILFLKANILSWRSVCLLCFIITLETYREWHIGNTLSISIFLLWGWSI